MHGRFHGSGFHSSGQVVQEPLQHEGVEQAHLGPHKMHFLGKVMKQNVFNRDHAWYNLIVRHVRTCF